MSQRFKSINTIEIYEMNGQEEPPLNRPKLIVSEDSSRDFVVVKIGDGGEATVNARDLIRAINNATNAHP